MTGKRGKQEGRQAGGKEGRKEGRKGAGKRRGRVRKRGREGRRGGREGGETRWGGRREKGGREGGMEGWQTGRQGSRLRPVKVLGVHENVLLALVVPQLVGPAAVKWEGAAEKQVGDLLVMWSSLMTWPLVVGLHTLSEDSILFISSADTCTCVSSQPPPCPDLTEACQRPHGPCLQFLSSCRRTCSSVGS